MANRVLFGQRSSDYGFWVSKPGFNVLSTGVGNLLYNFEDEIASVVISGMATVPAAPDYPTDLGIVNITVPNQGFYPRVFMTTTEASSLGWLNWLFPNMSTLRIRNYDEFQSYTVQFYVFNQQG